jgi:hypothetical protein
MRRTDDERDMDFPYDRYETITQDFTVYYPPGEEKLARWVIPTIEKANEHLRQLLGPFETDMDVLIVAPDDWHLAPHDDAEELIAPHPYWTETTSPPTLVVPTEIDSIFGEMTAPKFAFILYHELALAATELDSRPWPDSYPLWADEWPLKFAALWLSYTIDQQDGLVNQDLADKHEDLFEAEEDGKTPTTVRSFDWFEDTTPEEYLKYQILLEQFAADLLACYPPTILPRFFQLFRTKRKALLSEEVTEMLAQVLGPGGGLWLEDLVYF